jgi:hypothetical protein
VSPSELLFLILRKSSKKPMKAKEIVVTRTTQIYLLLKSAQRRVEINIDEIIKMPPIVGVPVFL